MSIKQLVRQEFEQRFGEPPTVIVRAPGRVNLIGEHTDYNEGFVLPLAIDRALWIGLRARDDRRVMAYSLSFDEMAEFDLDSIEHSKSGWSEYLKGVAWALQEAGEALCGWEGIIGSDVPVGAGLSSSAALELATARAFAVVSGFAWQPTQMALLGQRVENQWIGINSGMMDQMISAKGEAGHAILLDCRSLETESVPLPSEVAVVVLDTATRRGLVDSAYNERRSQCEAAARFFSRSALRDVSWADFEAQASQLDDVTRRRALHVISENERTTQTAHALRQGALDTVGKLMYESHCSLRDDFEVSSDALNTMVEIARQHLGCIGTRMTGGGFGGCAVALVELDQANDFAQQVARAYQEATSLKPNIYLCQATNGAEVIA
jgi:galactokinase